jgi:hypothetical protein
VADRFTGNWAAGQVAEGKPTRLRHDLASLHIIARCSCGSAYMSTDGSIAVGQLNDHIAAEHRSPQNTSQAVPADG